MSDADIARAFSWMAAHGQQVQSLVLRASIEQQPLPPDLFSRAAPSLSSITWLEVAQRHSLVLLAPVLGQLPQLKHLAVQVDLGRHPDSDKEDDEFDGDPYWGFFLDQDGNMLPVPDMGQLCPQLEHLSLTVNAVADWLCIDSDLAGLLPAGLQVLRLQAEWHAGVCLDAADLEYATALQQLTLDGVKMREHHTSYMMERLGALQQLRVFSPFPSQREDLRVLLAPKLTSHWHKGKWTVQLNSELLHLGVLMLNWYDTCVPDSLAAALSPLKSLEALSLTGSMWGEGLAGVLQEVAGMPALRSLQLEGSVADPSQLSSGLAQCTQLTALTLLARVGADTAFVSLPQQLSGLCSLAVPAVVVGYEEGAWLAHLPHLTSLCVCVPSSRAQRLGSLMYAVVEGAVCRVRCWPAILQQVRRAVGATFQPALWQFTPRVVGAAPVTLWLQEEEWAAHGWSKPLKPLTCLPGVWELQGSSHGNFWSRSRPREVFASYSLLPHVLPPCNV
jgi:hypothetical protein